MKKWKCVVCGYIHTGDVPPEVCPLCGADRSKFIEVTEEETTSAEKSSKIVLKGRLATYRPILETLNSLISKHHLHPISVHIPNGVIPVSAIFIILGMVFQAGGLAMASFYNMIVVVITMPMVLYSGYVDWQNRYGGNLTNLFLAKMICGAIVTIISLIVVIWWLINPAAATNSSRLLFVFIHLIMLAAAGIAGFLGGKLVFKR